MNLPTLATLLCVLAYPVLAAAYLSFHKVSLRELRQGIFPYVGLANFEKLFADPLFVLSMRNTLVFTAFSVAIEVVAGLAIAVLINRSDLWSSRVTRALVLLPFAVPPIANGFIWTFIYNFDAGFLNRILFTLGLIDTPINWIADPRTALFAVAMPYIWRSLPFCILLIHAGLQGIDRQLYESAAIDGAGGWRAFWSITLPMLRPIIAILLILRTASAVVVFDEILAITRGGPGDATWVAAWYSYQSSFQPPFDIGAGAASAYVLAGVIAVMAIVYVTFVYRRVD